MTDGDEDTADAMTTRRALDSKLPLTLDLLASSGKAIVFRPWPQLSAWPNYQVERVAWWHQSGSGRTTVARADFVRENAGINGLFDRYQGRITFFDPSQKICADGECVSLYDRVRMYSDPYHITPAGTMQFRQDIESLLSTAM